MQGNKLAWEKEARDSGIEIRRNRAPLGGASGWGEDLGNEAFNRGGFRGFGEVGSPTSLPNGEPISYKDIDLPKGLTNLLGIGGEKEKPGGASGSLGSFDFENIPLKDAPLNVGFQGGDPRNVMNIDPSTITDPRWFNRSFYTESPYVRDIFDTSAAPVARFARKWGDEIGAAGKFILSGFNPMYGASLGAKQFLQMITPGHRDFNESMWNKVPKNIRTQIRNGNADEVMKWASLIIGNIGKA